MPQRLLSRRELIIKAAQAGIALGFAPACTRMPALHWHAPHRKNTDYPIDPSIPEVAPRQFFGDPDPARFHKIFWDKAGFFASPAGQPPPPAATEDAEVVIVGGGVAGLTAALELWSKKPVVLEASNHFGGNSQAQSWRGAEYPLGAVYFNKPTPGTDLHRILFGELNLEPLCFQVPEEDLVVANQTIAEGFWSGKLFPEHKAYLAKWHEYLQSLNADDSKDAFPEIPWDGAEQSQAAKALDADSLTEFLKKKFGPVPRPLKALLDNFCRSALGGSADEVSSAAGINFLASEFLPRLSHPAGNAVVTENLFKRLVTLNLSEQLRSESFVVDVSVQEKGCRVLYCDRGGNLHAINCRTVIMACPKHVVARVLQDMEPGRQKAISSLSYRSYLVANLCLQGRPGKDFFDLYFLNDGKPASLSTDLLWTNRKLGEPTHTVVTAYQPQLSGARSALMKPGAYEKERLKQEKDFESSLAKIFSFKSRQLKDIRIARWGHAFAIPRPGDYRRGLPEELRAPFRNRVFFAHQDNWMLPCLETAMLEGVRAVQDIRKLGLLDAK